MSDIREIAAEAERMEDEDLEVVNVEDEGLTIKLSKPYTFEGKEYTEVDLSGIEKMTAEDMIAVNKILERNGHVGTMPEVTIEYVVYMAARAAKLPVEFFKGLPMKDAIKVKGRITGFLFV